MRRSILVFVVVCLLVSAIAGCAKEAAPIPTPERKTVTIIDERGKQVEIPQPLEKIVVFNAYNMELVRAVGGWKSIVGLDEGATKNPDYVPGFDMKNIAGKGQMEPNYEKIVSLKPQVVIFPINSAWAEAEEKLSPFGIKVIVITGWDIKGFTTRVATLGLMFGKTEKAQELIGFYQKHIDLVQERVKKLEKKRRVYYESSVGDYKTCLVGSGHHDMIESAGGINVFGDISFAEQPKVKGSVHDFEIDPEAILVRNPQLVLKYLPGATYAPCKPEELKGIWEKLVSRPGWDKLDAVKNNNVRVTTMPLTNSCSKMVGVCYLAKWLYPELFPDLEPEAVMKEWCEKYQGIRYYDVFRDHVYTPK